jgi:hypothetical protein
MGELIQKTGEKEILPRQSTKTSHSGSLGQHGAVASVKKGWWASGVRGAWLQGDGHNGQASSLGPVRCGLEGL